MTSESPAEIAGLSLFKQDNYKKIFLKPPHIFKNIYFIYTRFILST